MDYPEGADNAKAPWNQEEDTRDECPICGEPSDYLDYEVNHWGRVVDVCECCADRWEAFVGTCSDCGSKENNPHCVDEGGDLVLCEPCHLSWIFSGDLGEWHELQPKVTA